MSLDLTDPLPLAQALLAEPSVTPQAAGCFDLLEGWLTALGFIVHRRIFEGDGGEPTENLYARRGEGSPNLCFAGHVDVVPPGDLARWDSPPFSPEIRDGHLYGRGAEDMKGAIAAMVAAVARVRDHGGSVSFLLTADEEGSAINGTPKALACVTGELGQRLDYCLVGEPTNPNFLGEMAKIGRRGSLLGTLTVHGRQGHVAYPELADNPATRLIAILQALKSAAIDEGSDFFPPSNLEVTTIDIGNAVDNLIPETARARFNIRFGDRHTGESLSRWLREVCAHANGRSDGFDLDIRISGESFLSAPGVLSETLGASIRAVTGHVPQLSTTGGTSDARFIRHHCPVIEFGTTGHTPHQANERVAVEVLRQLCAVYADFITRLPGAVA